MWFSGSVCAWCLTHGCPGGNEVSPSNWFCLENRGHPLWNEDHNWSQLFFENAKSWLIPYIPDLCSRHVVAGRNPKGPWFAGGSVRLRGHCVRTPPESSLHLQGELHLIPLPQEMSVVSSSPFQWTEEVVVPLCEDVHQGPSSTWSQNMPTPLP